MLLTPHQPMTLDILYVQVWILNIGAAHRVGYQLLFPFLGRTGRLREDSSPHIDKSSALVL